MRICLSILVPVAATAALVGCSGGAPAPEAGEFADACNASGNLDPELCACLDEQAAGLEPDTHRFVIATIAENEAEAQRLRGDLDEAEATQAAQFISRGIQSCIIDLPASGEEGGIEAGEPVTTDEGAMAPAGEDAMTGETAIDDATGATSEDAPAYE